MNYEDYSKKFKEKAKFEGKSDEYINSYLQYAKKLSDNNLPIIYNSKHFSLLVGIKLECLLNISNSQEYYYRKFYINKRNGKKRKIEEPLPTLKEVQNFILHNILYKVNCSRYSKAFIPNISLVHNAKFHRNQKYLLKIDLKDYFFSIHASKVYNFFLKLNYEKNLCVLLTKLCTVKEYLPQGAPTSPYLSNLVTIDLDEDIFQYCNSQEPKLRYSRYADDISISGESLPSNIVNQISKIIKQNNLAINYEKIHIFKNHQKQIVTGIVVNEKLQAEKKYRKSIRLEMYYINKFGIEKHLEKRNDKTSHEDYYRKLLGKVSFCLQVNKKDEQMLEYKETLIKLIKSIKN